MTLDNATMCSTSCTYEHFTKSAMDYIGADFGCLVIVNGDQI